MPGLKKKSRVLKQSVLTKMRKIIYVFFGLTFLNRGCPKALNVQPELDEVAGLPGVQVLNEVAQC